MSGTVAVANGGTGATTAAGARAALGVGSVGTLNTNANAGTYLNGNGAWSTPTASVPTGTWCGFSCDATVYSTCQGLDPFTGCPSGYTKRTMYYGCYDSGSRLPGYYCTKN